nr:ionotropic receptor 25a-like [Procambarus clarkii]
MAAHSRMGSLLCLLMLVRTALAQLTIVSTIDESLQEGAGWLDEAVSQAQKETGLTLSQEVVKVSLDNEEDGQQKLCSALYSGAAVVVDVTAGGWTHAQDTAAAYGIPYVRVQVSNYQWMAATDQLLESRNATDAALIFGSEAELDQALYYLVEGSAVRVIVLAGVDQSTTEMLKKMRPSPSYYVILGTTDHLSLLFSKAVEKSLVTRDSRWTLVATDHKSHQFDRGALRGLQSVTLVAPAQEVCCTVRNRQSLCDCDTLIISREMTMNSMLTLTNVLKGNAGKNVRGSCGETPPNPPSTTSFYSALQTSLREWKQVEWEADKLQVVPQLKLDITAINTSTSSALGSWSTSEKLQLNPQFKNSPIKRHFKIGTVMARPWVSSKSESPGDQQYEGYCVELAARLALYMNFDYEFKFPEDGQYGVRQNNGSWNGLVGDLSNGVTDIIIAPLTMTSEREEVIDFVAPYFDQSGISIGQKFTLKESFWFALTSFTPQGGGEAPKALSGRTLVAAYWLFVVLMLATFTANLAAFLTVERMQTPVSSLDELAGQSKINYTVLQSSAIYQYFANMAAAEEELYRVWKELTLNSTSDQSKYRVWDYPIKEQYTHILQVIDQSGPVERAQLGFDKVLKNKDGDFAFIHDASEIRYEVYHNCLLAEVGEPFAEQPYAIAVQQGSHLQDEISRAILELQKDRYFEALSAQFWNSSARGTCPNDNDSEGITLQSLGGVFIATLIGLALAMIALAAEVLYYRRGGVSLVTDLTPKAAFKLTSEKDRVSRINVIPAY